MRTSEPSILKRVELANIYSFLH